MKAVELTRTLKIKAVFGMIAEIYNLQEPGFGLFMGGSEGIEISRDDTCSGLDMAHGKTARFKRICCK